MISLRSPLILGVCSALILLATPAAGWEFSLSANSTFSHLYYTQTGNKGFFGTYDQSSVADYYSANGWLGEGLGVVSGADASNSSVSMNFFPRFSVNKFFFISGVFRAGNTEVGTFPGAEISFAGGEMMQWFAVFETPWGVASYGKRPFGFGHGLQYDATNRTEEYLALVSDMGPLQIGLGVYPSRQSVELNPNRDYLDDPFRMYWNPDDKSGRPEVDLFGFINYASGPLEAGFGCLYSRQHQGPEGTWLDGARDSIPTLDMDINEGWIYLRYYNGRFFLNGEADWDYRTARFQRSLLGDFLHPNPAIGNVAENADGSGSIFRPQYTESWRYMVEFGLLVGPWKASFLYAFLPGPDRRHGVLIDRQPVIVNPYLPNSDAVTHHPDHGNTTLFMPYSTILCTDYGAGVGALNRGAKGYMVDASILAARIDYAVAANLNLHTSFLYANRVSHGYGWGFIRPDQITDPLGVVVGLGVMFNRNRNFTAPVPAIPDNSLGWEVTAGLNWELMDSLIIGLTAAYWKPGRWFNYACIDRSVPAWTVPVAGNNWGANPDREIDGIFGLNWSISANF